MAYELMCVRTIVGTMPAETLGPMGTSWDRERCRPFHFAAWPGQADVGRLAVTRA